MMLSKQELETSIIPESVVFETTLDHCPTKNANDYGRGVIRMSYGWVTCDFVNGVAYLDKHPQHPEGHEVAIYHNEAVMRSDIRFFVN